MIRYQTDLIPLPRDTISIDKEAFIQFASGHVVHLCQMSHCVTLKFVWRCEFDSFGLESLNHFDLRFVNNNSSTISIIPIIPIPIPIPIRSLAKTVV
jgi:hypothetical protein